MVVLGSIPIISTQLPFQYIYFISLLTNYLADWDYSVLIGYYLWRVTNQAACVVGITLSRATDWWRQTQTGRLFSDKVLYFLINLQSDTKNTHSYHLEIVSQVNNLTIPYPIWLVFALVKHWLYSYAFHPEAASSPSSYHLWARVIFSPFQMIYNETPISIHLNVNTLSTWAQSGHQALICSLTQCSSAGVYQLHHLNEQMEIRSRSRSSCDSRSPTSLHVKAHPQNNTLDMTATST